MTAPIAHSAHWLTSVAYLAPMVSFAATIAVLVVRERIRRGREAP